MDTANGRLCAPRFEGLGAKVIAVDRMSRPRPLSPDGFEAALGSRLDLGVAIPRDPALRTMPVVDRFARCPFVLASIRVFGSAVATPTFPSPPAQATVPAWRDAYSAALARPSELNRVEWTLSGEAYTEHAAHTGDCGDGIGVASGNGGNAQGVVPSQRAVPRHRSSSSARSCPKASQPKPRIPRRWRRPIANWQRRQDNTQ